MNNSLKAIVSINGKIRCETGLHIGGSGGGFEIGGVENQVIRNPRDGYPYIPGSSLKGKMRSLMEWAEGKVTSNGDVYYSKNDVDDVISRIFGAPAEANRLAGPTRIIVRDALPDDKTRKLLHKLEEEQGLPKVEVKTEVNINRITSKPLSGPRQMERVPEGSCFDFEILYAIYDVETLNVHDIDLLDRVFTAMRLVEDSFLGGSGSRGSGQVKFFLGKPLVRTLQDYKSGAPRENAGAQDSNLEQLIALTDFTSAMIDQLKGQLR